MAIVAPAILAETAEDYKASIERLEPFAEHVHIDVSDGEFAPTFTVNTNQLYWPVAWQTDIHAMVARPSEHVKAMAELKPRTIIFHVEVEEDLLPVLQQVKALGIRAGIALLKTTVPKNVSHLIEVADHVMIFTGELGKYGGNASLMQLEKVRLIRNIQPNVEIGWDGGVSVENAFTLSQGGVDVLNVGSTISNSSDPGATYKKLLVEINKHAVI